MTDNERAVESQDRYITIAKSEWQRFQDQSTRIAELEAELAAKDAELQKKSDTLDICLDVAMVRFYQMDHIHREATSNEEVAKLVREIATTWNDVPSGADTLIKLNAQLAALRTHNERLRELLSVVVTEVREFTNGTKEIAMQVNGVLCIGFHGTDEAASIQDWRLRRDAALTIDAGVVG